jgi:predicted transcriptional regulator
MTSFQQQIVARFLAKLAESTDMDAEKIEQLKNLLAETKKVKPDDLIKIFSLPVGEPIK